MKRRERRYGKKTVAVYDCLVCMLNRNQLRRAEDPYPFFIRCWRGEAKSKLRKGWVVAPPTLTRDEFYSLQAQTHCWCCGDQFSRRNHNKKLTIDRLVPSLGYRFDNCAALCLECNRRKNDSSLDDMKRMVSWLERELVTRGDGSWVMPTPQPIKKDIAFFKFIYGPAGPMIGVLAESEEQARALAIAELKKMDPDDHPEHPDSWFSHSELVVIELDKGPRIMCTA